MNRLTRLFLTSCVALLTLSPVRSEPGVSIHTVNGHNQDLLAHDLMNAFNVLERLQQRTEELKAQGVTENIESMHLPAEFEQIRSTTLKETLVKLLSITRFSKPEELFTVLTAARTALTTFEARMKQIITHPSASAKAPADTSVPTLPVSSDTLAQNNDALTEAPTDPLSLVDAKPTTPEKPNGPAGFEDVEVTVNPLDEVEMPDVDIVAVEDEKDEAPLPAMMPKEPATNNEESGDIFDKKNKDSDTNPTDLTRELPELPLND